MKSRQSTRYPVEIEGRYWTGNGLARDVLIKDLSIDGCSMLVPFCNLEPGAVISIKIGSLGPIHARVRREIKGGVGLQFVKPLQPSDLNQMRSTLE